MRTTRRSIAGVALILTAAAALGAAAFPAGAAAVDPGASAPAFELARFDGGVVRSADLFSTHAGTFLVFWRSSCSHCVEALGGCQRFARDFGGDDVAVIGVNGDERTLGAWAAVEAGGVTFPQARDPGEAVAARYGVPRGAFAVVLVDSPGIVRAVRIEPQGDLRAVMEEMLASPAPEDARGAAGAAEGTGAAAGGETTVHALQRIRLLAIDTGANEEAAGLYGEPVRSMRAAQYRLEVEASRRLAPHLRAGGLLRISNEGDEVLEAGPEYFGSRWGSAFAEVDAGAFRARIGYYRYFMTPLTFMRWDWDDNPRIGGDTGCGCGGPAAGMLLVESLEELGPDLTVEGALLSYGFGGAEAVLFYAIPRRALETSYAAYRFADAERARYSQEIAGMEARWQRLDRRTGLFWKAGLHFISTFDNKRSVRFGELGYSSVDPWLSTWTVSATAEAPLVRYARLRGEIVAFNRTKESGILTDRGFTDETRGGGGGFGGMVIEKSTGPGIAIDWLRLTPGFYTPYSALSYESNAEGVRVSGRTPLPRDLASLSAFYKWLQDADLTAPGIDRKKTWLAGASLDLDIGRGFAGEIGWLERRSRREGTLAPVDARRRAFVASVERDFGRVGMLRFQYELVRDRDAAVAPALETQASLFSLYSSVGF